MAGEINKILTDYRNTLQTIKISPSTSKDELTRIHKSISKMNVELENAKEISAFPANLSDETVRAIESLKTQITKSKIEKASPGIAPVISDITHALERTNQILREKAQKKAKGVSDVEEEQLNPE